MAKQEFSVPALMTRLISEHDAYQFLEELRWAGQPVCHHCGSIAQHYYLKPKDGTTGRKTRTGANTQRRVWKCKDCRKQFSVLTGTIFHGTKISVRTWVLVIAEVCMSKNGISAREVERKYDLTAKSAWFMLHRIREAMKQEPLAALLVGTVAVDETYIGGDPGNQHASKRIAMGPERWVTAKTTVLSLVDTVTGETRSRIVPDVTGATLRKVIADQVDMANTDLMTDSATWYRRTPHAAGSTVPFLERLGGTGGTSSGERDRTQDPARHRDAPTQRPAQHPVVSRGGRSRPTGCSRTRHPSGRATTHGPDEGDRLLNPTTRRLPNRPFP